MPLLMADPNTIPPELPAEFTVVKITFNDGCTQFGYWDGKQWVSQFKCIESKTIHKWEALPAHT